MTQNAPMGCSVFHIGEAALFWGSCHWIGVPVLLTGQGDALLGVFLKWCSHVS